MQTTAKDIYFVPSDKLKELKEFVKAWKDASQHIGGAVQFRVVVDTNVVLADIRWLAYKRKNAAARTSLIETIEAGTIDVYVPPALHDEVEEHIERIAIEEGLDQARLMSVWWEYQKKLKVVEPDNDVIQSYRGGVDPDDAVFIALAEVIGAVGVVSNDQHIAMMGGKKISVDCVLSLRDYSRATAIELNIKCMGISLGLLSVVAIRGLFEGIKALIIGISRAPDWMKLALVLGVAICIIHPGARAKIANGFKRALAGIKEATPTVVAHIADAASIAQQQSTIAQSHLDKALEELDSNEPK
jgi:predicted nucleic acid-binding protein